MTPVQYSVCVQSAADYTDPDAYVSDLSTSSIWGDAETSTIPADRLDALREIYTACHRSVMDIVQLSGMSRAAFARKHCIPVRTVINWCLPDTSQEHRDCPLYVRLLLQRAEGLLRV